jgi:hypothetical protein
MLADKKTMLHAVCCPSYTHLTKTNCFWAVLKHLEFTTKHKQEMQLLGQYEDSTHVALTPKTYTEELFDTCWNSIQNICDYEWGYCWTCSRNDSSVT